MFKITTPAAFNTHSFFILYSITTFQNNTGIDSAANPCLCSHLTLFHRFLFGFYIQLIKKGG